MRIWCRVCDVQIGDETVDACPFCDGPLTVAHTTVHAADAKTPCVDWPDVEDVSEGVSRTRRPASARKPRTRTNGRKRSAR